MKSPILFSMVWGFAFVTAGFFAGSVCADTNLAGTALSPVLSSVAGKQRLSKPAVTDHKLSHSTTQVVQLTQSGIDENVVLSFVENLGAFNLAAEHIITLKNLGVSSRVVSAMLAHDRELVARADSLAATNVLAEMKDGSAATSESSQIHPQRTVISTQPNVTVADATIIEDTSTQVETSVASTQVTTTSPSAVVPTQPVSIPAQTRSFKPLPKKNPLYPVREPYPVELTTPIVFLDCPTF